MKSPSAGGELRLSLPTQEIPVAAPAACTKRCGGNSGDQHGVCGQQLRLDNASTSCDHAINKQNDNSANHGADQPRTLAWAIPTERLAEKRRNERSHDSQNGGENEASRLVISRHDELRDDA